MPSAGRSAPREYRATSPDTLRQLYGVPVSQIRSSGDVFRKETYKRDKQRLKRVMDAINAEKKQVERKWDARKSQFAQQHALHVPQRKRTEVVYQKVATLEAQPENVVPPCIPFVGTFPPFRHPTKPRRISEMFKEPLFSRRVFHSHSAEQKGKEEGEWRWEGPLSNGGASLLPSADSFATSSQTATRGEAGSHDDLACLSRVQQGQSRNARSADTTSSREAYQFCPNGFVDSTDTRMSKQAIANSLRTTQGHTDQKVNSNETADNQLQVMDDGYHIDCEVNNKWFEPMTNDIYSQMTYNSSQLSARVKMQHNKGLAIENNISLQKRPRMKSTPKKKNAASEVDSQRLSRVVEQVVSADRAKDALQLGADNIQEAVEREGEETPGDEDLCSRRSEMTSTPDSLDIDLLQQALLDHAAENLNRNRWQRMIEHVRIPAISVSGDDAAVLPPLLHKAESFYGSTLSLPSVSTPTTRSATDASEVAADGGMAVVQIIMQLLRELDQPQLSSLADVWPSKMEKMMSTIGDLVRDTGVDVTEIVEKIQRGDAQDEKSAALLDWISNIDTTIPAGLQGESELTDNQHACNYRVSFSINNDRRRGNFMEDATGNLLPEEFTRVGSRRSSTSMAKGSAEKGSVRQETAQRRPGNTTVDISLSSRRRSVEQRPKSQSASSACLAPCTTTDAVTFCQVRRASIHRGHSAVIASHSKHPVMPSSCSDTFKNENKSGTKLSSYPHSCPYSGISNFSLLNQRDDAEIKSEHLLPCVDRSRPLIFVKEDSQPSPTNLDNSPGVAVSLTPSSKTLRSSSHVRAKVAGEHDCPQNSHQAKHVGFLNISSAVIVDTASRFCGGKRDDGENTEFRASSLSRCAVRSNVSASPTLSPKRRASSTGRETASTGTESRLRVNQSSAMTRERFMDRQGIETAYGEKPTVSSCSQSTQVTDDNPIEEQEQTLFHTDRRGRMHRLTMRKVSLSQVSTREVNVTVTRDDNAVDAGPLNNDNNNVDHKDTSVSQTVMKDSSSSKAGETKQNEQQSPSSSPAADSMGTAPHHPEVLHNDIKDEEKTKETGEKHSEERTDEKTEEEDYEGLWRRRLAHSRHMSWVQELTTDHRAQGRALSLLLSKEGGGPKFRSVALKVICINALRVAKHVYDDRTYRVLRNCRYLRMPEEYLPDTQRELDVHEIFA